jgi:ribosomal RNA-processing protein 36
MKRASKNAPAIMKSNKPVGRLRLDPNLKLNSSSRDPRFSDVSGKLDHKKFLDSFAFLNEYQEKEVEMLSKTLKKVKNEEEKEMMKANLLKANQELTERKRDQSLKRKLSELKSIEKEKVCSYFMIFRMYIQYV